MAISTQGIINDATQDQVKQQAKPEIEPVKPQADEYKAPEVEPVATEVQPITTEVDPVTETVESRLNRMTAEGSRYTDIARKGAIRQAATRGLINTTMAGAAGEEAAIRAALPIAQQDVRPFTETRMANQAQRNEFLRDQQSAALNERLSTLESSLAQNEMVLDDKLRTSFEKTLQDARFADESKIQFVTAMNDIIRDSQMQITEVGLSDRSAEQQAAAIQVVTAHRDAELAVYEDLLSSFNDWEWSTDFTPKQAIPLTPTAVGAEPETREEETVRQGVASGEYRNRDVPPSGETRENYSTGSTTSSDGKWIWDLSRGRWEAY